MHCRVRKELKIMIEPTVFDEEEEILTSTTLPESSRSSCLSNASVECPHLSIDDRKRLIVELINVY